MEIENKHGVMSRSLENLCAELKEQSDYCAHNSVGEVKKAKKKSKKPKHKSVEVTTTKSATSEVFFRLI